MTPDEYRDEHPRECLVVEKVWEWREHILPKLDPKWIRGESMRTLTALLGHGLRIDELEQFGDIVALSVYSYKSPGPRRCIIRGAEAPALAEAVFEAAVAVAESGVLD